LQTRPGYALLIRAGYVQSLSGSLEAGGRSVSTVFASLARALLMLAATSAAAPIPVDASSERRLIFFLDTISSSRKAFALGDLSLANETSLNFQKIPVFCMRKE
jgi:hypothetical protein